MPHQFKHMPHHFHPGYAGGGGQAILQLITIVLILTWLWMLVDCAHNNQLRAGIKFRWLLLILCLPPLGAIWYFFSERVFFRTSSQQQVRAITYYQPNEPLRDYRQGYQAVPVWQPAKPLETPQFREVRAEREVIHDWQNYEQPQANYPEMPRQQ